MLGLVVILTVFLSGILRGMAGFGFALVAVPLLSLLLAPVEAVTLGILLQVAVGTFEVRPMLRFAHRPSLYRLAAGSLVGTPIGVFALTALSPDAARILIALAILAGLVAIQWHPSVSQTKTNGLAVSAGLASGVFSGLAAIPGPPAVAYYLGTGVSARQTRASLLIFCFVTVLAAVPGLLLAGAVDRNILLMCAYSCPALAAGTYIGAQIFERLKNDQYRTIGVTVMAAAAALAGWCGIAAYL